MLMLVVTGTDILLVQSVMHCCIGSLCFGPTCDFSWVAVQCQLICFYSQGSDKQHPTIIFNNTKLNYADRVMHLGHILTSNQDDREDHKVQ